MSREDDRRRGEHESPPSSGLSGQRGSHPQGRKADRRGPCPPLAQKVLEGQDFCGPCFVQGRIPGA